MTLGHPHIWGWHVILEVIPTFRDVYSKDLFLRNVSCYPQGQSHIQGWHVIPNVICEWHVKPEVINAFRDDMSIPRICVLPYVSCHPLRCPCNPEVIPVFGDDMSSLTSSRHLGMTCHLHAHPHIWGWDVIPNVIPAFRDDISSMLSPRLSLYLGMTLLGNVQGCSGMTCYSWHHSHLLFPFTKQQTTVLHKAYWLPCLQLTVLWQNWCQTQISHFVIIWGLIWKCCEWVYWSKLILEVKLNMICGIPMWKQETIYAGAARGEFLVLLQAQNTV